jgi:PEP-CTERM motif
MKRFLLFLPVLFLTLTSSSAFADQIYLSPNLGSGDNFGFVGSMNGHPLFLGGGTSYELFGQGGYAPGSVFGGGGTLYLDPADVWINGAPMTFGFPETMSFIGMTSITLPTNGRDFFTVPWQINFSATGVSFDTGQTIQVSGSARGELSFYYISQTGLYYPDSFVQTPEPGTLGLLGTGIIGILASIRNRLKRPAV